MFYLEDRKLAVDIVCDGGLSWYKVVARNPKSLSQICMGDASFGVKSILDQAEEFIECAELHPCLFQIPKVYKFLFYFMYSLYIFCFRLSLFLLMELLKI